MKRWLVALLLACSTTAHAGSSLIGCTENGGGVYADTYYTNLNGGGCTHYLSMSENLAKLRLSRTGLSIRKLGVYVSANTLSTGTTVFTSRVNNAAGTQSFSVAALGTGYSSDASNSDSLTSGDTIDMRMVTGGGSTESITVDSVTAELRTTGHTTCVLGAAYNTFAQAAATTTYVSIVGSLVGNGGGGWANDTSYNTEFLVRAGGEGYGLQVGMNQAITADTTITLRRNAADTALVVSIPSGSAAGFYEDTTHQLRLARGDKIDLKVVTGVGSGTLKLQMASMRVDSDDAQCDMGTSGVRAISGAGARNDAFAMFGELQTYGTDTSRWAAKVPFATTVGGLRVAIASTVSGTAPGIYTLRKNGVATSVTVTVPQGSTAGWYRSACALSATVLAGDTLDVNFTSTGTWNVTSLSMTGVTLGYDDVAQCSDAQVYGFVAE